MAGQNTPLVCVWLRGKFHAELRQDDGTQQAIANAEWAGSYARVLLKYLLSAPGRRASRSDLIDDLWPGDHENADQYLYVASSKLRKIFRNKEIIIRQAGGYELAGPAVLWSDIEECERLMIQAERAMIDTEHRGLSSAHVILLLERVSRHFQRGGMLEGEAGEWCILLRTQQEKATRYCHIMLAKGYESQGLIWLAQKQYQRLFEINPIDEDALCRELCMLQRQGMLDDLRSAYGDAQKRFEKYQMALSESTTKLFEHLMQEPIPFSLYTSPPKEWSRSLKNETEQQPQTSLVQRWPITYNMSSQLSAFPFPEKLELLMIPRRKVLHDILQFASSSLVLSPNVLLPQESREHLERALTSSSYLDEEAVDHLAAITQNLWALRKKTAGMDLLDSVVGHIMTITQFLKESRPTNISKKLCALASETARLLGQIFHEIREYDLAWDSYAFALKLAQEVDDADSWGSVVARLAELLIYWGEPQEALPFIEEAYRKGIADQRLRVQLASVEAEIYARAKDMDACLRLLEKSKKITLPVSLADDRYRTGFTPSVARGWEAACWIHLRQPEKALPILNGSFATHDPTDTRRRSYLLANRGKVYGQMGEVKKACELLLDSLDITAQTKSLITLQRVHQGRGELDPWKESGDVKELDARIVEVYKSLGKVKERA